MEKFNNVNEILNFAIKSEQEAVDFYTGLASQMKNPEIKETFLQFAREEVGHKAKLQKIKDEGIFDMNTEKIADLKIADYIVKANPSSDMNYAEALIIAMKKEKAAYKLYTNLEKSTENPELKKIFQNLAIEESKHKLRFEKEYDDYLMREN